MDTKASSSPNEARMIATVSAVDSSVALGTLSAALMPGLRFCRSRRKSTADTTGFLLLPLHPHMNVFIICISCARWYNKRLLAVCASLEMCLNESVASELFNRFVLLQANEDPMVVMAKIQEAYWFFIDFMSEQKPSFCGFVHQFAPRLGWPHRDVKDTIKRFWKHSLKLPRAGGILLNADRTMVLLVRGRGANTWGFPVGKVQNNEPFHKCAEREVFEETGFAGQVIDTEQYFVYRKRKAEHRLFVFDNVPVEYDFQPQTRLEIDEVRWFAFGDLIGVLPKRVREQLVAFLGVYVYA